MNNINESSNNFEQCIKCTVCTAYCPVLPINLNFPGPKHGGPDQERFRLKLPDYYDESLKYCLNCKRCEVACPSNVHIGDIIQLARIKYSKNKPKLRDYILSHTDLVGSLATPFAPIVNSVMKLKPTKMILDSILSIDKHRVFPLYSFGTFRSWMKKQKESQSKYKTQVSYFHGCYVNYNNPTLGKDMIKVFNALGIGVQLLEKEKCCGVAMISNGFINEAQKHGEDNIKHIRKSIIEDNRTVVATSSTCVFTIRDEYPNILNINNSDIKDNIELATRYIYRLLDESNAAKKLKFINKKIRIGYHTPCHMEKLGWSYYSIELLKQIPGIELVVLNSQCCGIAGTYGFKKENYPTSQEIGKELFQQIESGNFDYIVSDCETCKWQIEMSTSKQCKHPLTVLADCLQ